MKTYLRLNSDEAVIDRRFIGDWSPFGCKMVSKNCLSITNKLQKLSMTDWGSYSYSKYGHKLVALFSAIISRSQLKPVVKRSHHGRIVLVMVA